jgi:hypothetical protein
MTTAARRPRRFYVAAYATRALDGRHYAGYAKVCVRKPRSYWEAPCVFKLFGGDHHDTPEAAIESAKAAAAQQIARLPRTDITRLGFPMLNEAREIVFPLAQAILNKAG